MSAPNPPYGRRPVEGGPGSPHPTPPGGMPPYGHGPAPAGPPPRGPAPYGPGPYGPTPHSPAPHGAPHHGRPPSGTPGYGMPRQVPPPVPGPRPEPAADPWRASAPTDRHHPGPPTPAPGGPGTPPPGGPPHGGAGADNPLIPPGVNGVPLPGPVPDVVARAFLVWLVPIPLNVVAMLLTGLSSGDLGGLGVSIFGIVVALVGGAIGVYLALHFRGGRNWARIVLTVISGLVLAVELFSVPASLFLIVFAPVVGVISLAISVAIAACEVLFLVLAWKAEASAYLR